jgi:hypothetical protein
VPESLAARRTCAARACRSNVTLPRPFPGRGFGRTTVHTVQRIERRDEQKLVVSSSRPATNLHVQLSSEYPR